MATRSTALHEVTAQRAFLARAALQSEKSVLNLQVGPAARCMTKSNVINWRILSSSQWRKIERFELKPGTQCIWATCAPVIRGQHGVFGIGLTISWSYSKLTNSHKRPSAVPAPSLGLNRPRQTRAPAVRADGISTAGANSAISTAVGGGVNSASMTHLAC